MGAKKRPLSYEEMHGKPVTRREMLASGAIPFAATMFMPTWLQIMARSGVAEAQDLVCKVAGVSGLCPFIGIKLSGGMAMAANFLPHDRGKQLLPSYSKMGMGTGAGMNVDFEFANRAPFYGNSQLLEGIRQQALPTTLANANFVGVNVRSQDDSTMNKADITGLVSKAGISGKILPNLGRANTDTGISSTYAFLRPAAPLIVSRYEDIPGALGVSGSLASLSNNQKTQLFNAFSSMSSTQARNIANVTNGALLGQLVQCANRDNSTAIGNASSGNTDPLGNTQFAQIWGINVNTPKSSQAFVFASMIFNALNGNAGTVNLEIGGFDYHNGTRTAGDAKDLEAGIVIGRILQSMALLRTKGFIVVTSDGSVTSPESDLAGGPWTSDRGVAGASYMIGYDPAGPHTVKSFQLGHFTSAQAADDLFITGGSMEKAAGAMFANYLAFNGMLGSFENLLPRIFTTNELELVTIYS